MPLSGVSNCSAGEQDPYGQRHRWVPAPGRPLACIQCGENWPGGPLPEYVCTVEGNHRDELIRDDIWTVQRMIRELKREFGD